MMSYGRAVYPAQALSTTFPSWPTRQSSRQSSQSSPEQKALSVTSWHVTWPVLRIFAHVCSYLDFGVAEELSDFSCIACGIYIYNEMLQPDCNNLPNALPGALHCRWICPGKEGTCEPPVIDSWKSKSMSSTSCTWVCKCYQMLNLLLWVWHSMAYLVTLCLKPSSSAWKCQSIRYNLVTNENLHKLS